MAARDYLHQAGLTVEVVGDKLRLHPAERVTDAVRQFVRDHRASLLAELSATNDPPAEALTWLARVALRLSCEPAYLLEHGFIDRHDLAEQYCTHPRLAARLIRSHPAWSPSASTDHPTIEQQDAGQPQPVHHSTATASPELRQARDQYLNHLMPCRLCHAPTDRYCVIGAELRATYDRTPLEPTPCRKA
ncbi:hypothetical protein PS934_04060 [Pseudomonas fluorescens]|uniref:hypothetical protein n=1 Tax=Pseudomonas fluorescens TaxID=294 RepID=UPI001241CEFD|nr:hypothetical protein [Pseudomonas fluorescens]VVQ14179.1 hypothetical protein PS934_04060 [Pseudomonas fluorescens]